jgi:hypothetical protein
MSTSTRSLRSAAEFGTLNLAWLGIVSQNDIERYGTVHTFAIHHLLWQEAGNPDRLGSPDPGVVAQGIPGDQDRTIVNLGTVLHAQGRTR